MATVEKITVQRTSGDLQKSDVNVDTNSFNNNLFANASHKNIELKPAGLFPNGENKPAELPKKIGTSLFGSKLVDSSENKQAADKNILPQASASNLDKISKFLKHQKTNLKNLLNTIGSNVNEYDAAVSSALKYLPGEGELKLIVDSNPRIKAILAEANMPVNMNYDNLKTIKNSHIATTVQFSRAIGKELGMNETELQTMEVGAALHDIGKTLIPSEILNKQGKLTKEERETVNYHSVLGYEILKSAGFGTNVAEIARDHHNPQSKNKYAQIVRAADVYSAMTEKRSYKEAKSHDEAMSVLRNMGINKEILAALDKNFAPKKETQSITPGFSTQPAVA